MKVNYEEITEGFVFELNGKDVIIITDYEKGDETKTVVQIAKVKTPKKSAGQLCKLELFNSLNESVEFRDILKKKQEYYGKTEASYEFAAEEYAIRKMIEENESILKMAKLHMDQRAVIVLKDKIIELKHMIGLKK